MKVPKFGVVAVSLIVATAPSIAFGATKAGTSCPKSGLTKIVDDRQYTCIKKNKKNVWSTGVKINLTEIPTDFSNLESRVDGIPLGTWREIQKKLKENPSAKTEIEIIMGPNTSERYSPSLTKKMVQLGSRVMGSLPQPPKTKFVEFSKTDVEWGKQQAGLYVSPFNLGNPLPSQAEGLCKGEDCDGAVTNYVSGIALVLAGISTPNNRYGDMSRFRGQNDLHEYVHSVQGILFANKQMKPPPLHLPCWYSEGQPQAVSIPTSATSQADYVALREDWMINYKWLLPDFEPSTVEKFLSDNMKVPCPVQTNSLNYSIGYIAIDALIAIGGIDKTFTLLSGVADGQTFEESFAREYKITWEEARPILARVISKSFKSARKIK